MSAVCRRWSLRRTPTTTSTTMMTMTTMPTITTKTMTTKTRMTTTKSRSAILAALLLASWAGNLTAQGKKQKGETAVIAGTVFRDPGFAQGGAVVVLALKSSPTKKLQEKTTAS